MTTHIAAAAFSRGLDCFLRAAGDPLAEIEPVLAEQPDFVMGHLLRVAVGVAARDPKMTLLARALDAAQMDAGRATDRERAHLDAARAWFTGEPRAAARGYTAILREWPHDVLALRLAQSCYFFLGRKTALRDVIELVWPAWTRDAPGYEYVLAMASFAYAENADPDRAEALAQQALELQPVFPFAIHALAHALFERGDHARGALWMRQHQPHWAGSGRMIAHNAWHAAMFDLESGAPERALATLDRCIMPLAGASATDAADATALLWHLQLEGIDPGARWLSLSNCWAAHSAPGFWPSLDLHASIAFNAAGDRGRARTLVRAISTCARGDTCAVHVARTVVLPALNAIEAFTTGAYAEAYASLRALRPALQRVASRVQQALFERMLREAQRGLCRPSAARRPGWALAA
jgi:tetratricopeptide (TPR) repeat protein